MATFKVNAGERKKATDVLNYVRVFLANLSGEAKLLVADGLFRMLADECIELKQRAATKEVASAKK